LDEHRDLDPNGHRHEYFVEYADEHAHPDEYLVQDIDFNSHLDFYGATDRDFYVFTYGNPHTDLDEHRDLDPYGHRHEYCVEYADEHVHPDEYFVQNINPHCHIHFDPDLNGHGDVDFHSHLDFVADGVLYLDFYGTTDWDLYLYADRNPHTDLDEYCDIDLDGHRHEYFVEYADEHVHFDEYLV
jgi:hypothetical protein